MDISVVILAAGEASRMGDIKQLLSFNNSTLLQTTINHALKSRAKKVYVVLGVNSDIVKDKISDEYVTIIQNLNWQEGLSSSIICAVNFFKKENIQPNAVLILLADQPAVEVSYLKKMIELHKKESTKIIASQYNLKYGVPALIPSQYFKNLLKIQGDKGAKKFLNQHSNIVTSIKEKTNLVDIDTPEQLKLFINN